MLGTKSGVGKLLKDEFPGIVLWHCLNHRLELAVGNAVDQGSQTRGPRAACGPGEHFVRPGVLCSILQIISIYFI